MTGVTLYSQLGEIMDSPLGIRYIDMCAVRLADQRASCSLTRKQKLGSREQRYLACKQWRKKAKRHSTRFGEEGECQHVLSTTCHLRRLPPISNPYISSLRIVLCESIAWNKVRSTTAVPGHFASWCFGSAPVTMCVRNRYYDRLVDLYQCPDASFQSLRLL